MSTDTNSTKRRLLMNKAMLIDKIAKDADITKSAAAAAVDSMISRCYRLHSRRTSESLWSASAPGPSANGSARIGRNPQTGEAIKIKAKKAVRFKAGKQLERALNK